MEKDKVVKVIEDVLNELEDVKDACGEISIELRTRTGDIDRLQDRLDGLRIEKEKAAADPEGEGA